MLGNTPAPMSLEFYDWVFDRQVPARSSSPDYVSEALNAMESNTFDTPATYAPAWIFEDDPTAPLDWDAAPRTPYQEFTVPQVPSASLKSRSVQVQNHGVTPRDTVGHLIHWGAVPQTATSRASPASDLPSSISDVSLSTPGLVSDDGDGDDSLDASNLEYGDCELNGDFTPRVKQTNNARFSRARMAMQHAASTSLTASSPVRVRKRHTPKETCKISIYISENDVAEHLAHMPDKSCFSNGQRCNGALRARCSWKRHVAAHKEGSMLYCPNPGCGASFSGSRLDALKRHLEGSCKHAP
ncbi:hypothetical protein EXIGLDRAFT_701619 [Exidia glandulosa HHB12029]|uniref:Uncharacterized protein n=1 Tax=Exidia glandulosa HHB12029 TaxID=1314781 RepID=A0A165Q394_EXIGL|nr:hypothetical protein EXIGLDRAFT_701619 [Exidia glandulosa HHB12029]